MKYIAVSQTGQLFLKGDSYPSQITSELSFANKYPTIGKAMKACADMNQMLGKAAFKVYSIYTE